MSEEIRPGGATIVTSEAVEEEASNASAKRAKVTFMGNSYDLTALGALASGILVLVTCLTCGQVFYCLPVIPIILGIIGLVLARDSVDAERTRLWSWLGIGGGGITILLTIVAVAGYFFMVMFFVLIGQAQY